jgi:hypothetical protein
MAKTSTRRIQLKDGWEVSLLVDDDGHLNIFVESQHGDMEEIETGQGNGLDGEQLAFRVASIALEKSFRKGETK